MEVNISIIKRREILPQLINPTQIFHELVRKQVVHRVHFKSQIFDFQGFAIFLLIMHHICTTELSHLSRSSDIFTSYP